MVTSCGELRISRWVWIYRMQQVEVPLAAITISTVRPVIDEKRARSYANAREGRSKG
jgi:hypothetical protein